jgi:WXG100 family type VII secretion target
MSDGNTFTVDLAALNDAIGQVSAERDTIQGGVATLRATFQDIESEWKSPAGTSFLTLTTTFNTITDRLMTVLEDAIDRMRTAHQNYATTEEQNTGNWTGSGDGTGDGTADPSQLAATPSSTGRLADNAPSGRELSTAPALVELNART